MSLRADLQQVIDEFDAADRAAEALVTPLTEAQFHFSVAPGQSWSIGQCIDHLATMNTIYCRALAQAIAAARQKGLTGGGAIAPSYFGRKFIATLEPPVTRKVGTPRAGTPRASGSRDEIMASYRASHETIREIVHRAADIDVNRATFQNPFLPLLRVRVGTALRILAAHERRHLWQAEQVRAAPAFPR